MTFIFSLEFKQPCLCWFLGNIGPLKLQKVFCLTASQHYPQCARGERSHAGGWDSPRPRQTWRTRHARSRLWSRMRRPARRWPAFRRWSLSVAKRRPDEFKGRHTHHFPCSRRAGPKRPKHIATDSETLNTEWNINSMWLFLLGGQHSCWMWHRLWLIWDRVLQCA